MYDLFGILFGCTAVALQLVSAVGLNLIPFHTIVIVDKP